MASKRTPGKVPFKIPPITADRIVATALQNPELGARRLVPLLKKKRIEVSASSVQNILRRNGLETRAKRMAKFEAPPQKARKPKSQPRKPPARIGDTDAERICEIALQNPKLGAKRLVPLLKKEEIKASSSAVYRILKRHGLQTKQKRLAARAEPVVFSKKFPNRIPVGVKDRIVDLSLQNPEFGAPRLVHLLEQEDILVSASSVYSILKRNNIENQQKRLLKLKEQKVPEAPPEPAIEIEEPLPELAEVGWPEPEYVPQDLAPMPADDEFPEPLPEPEEHEPLLAEDKTPEPEPFSEPVESPTIPPMDEPLLPVDEPEPVLEAVEAAPPEADPPTAQKTFFKFTHKQSHWIFRISGGAGDAIRQSRL